jgi:dihydroneopterin aldolase
VDRIVLRGIRVAARHGVTDAERSQAQDFEFDVSCSTDARAAARADDLTATIDYVRLRDLVVATATASSYRLLETLAERTAQAILEQLGPRWVRVRVTKLRPDSLGIPASIEIERGSEIPPSEDRTEGEGA